jgi:hypothetical protein
VGQREIAGPPSRVIVAGGWARSEAVRQIKQEVLGPFEYPNVTEAGGLWALPSSADSPRGSTGAWRTSLAGLEDQLRLSRARAPGFAWSARVIDYDRAWRQTMPWIVPHLSRERPEEVKKRRERPRNKCPGQDSDSRIAPGSQNRPGYPLKVETRVRTPLGLPSNDAGQRPYSASDRRQRRSSRAARSRQILHAVGAVSAVARMVTHFHDAITVEGGCVVPAVGGARRCDVRGS